MSGLEKLINVEKPSSTHIVHAYLPREADPNAFRRITDKSEIKGKLSDAAHYPGGHSPELIRLLPQAGPAEVSEIVRNSYNVLAIGAQTSLTGGATPDGSILIDMTSQKKVVIGEDFITVQPGVTFREAQEALGNNGKYLTSTPTHDGATVIGGIATNCAGADTHKHGQIREQVMGITVVLGTGEVIDIERGHYKAHKDGYFILDGPLGERRIDIPNYQMPDVPKISAGYYAKPEMDLIELFIGSEGTLGVITEAKLRVIPKPVTLWARISCESEQLAFELTDRLRKNPLTAAVEYMDEKSLKLLRDPDNKQDGIIPPPDAITLLLVQLEMNPNTTIKSYDDLAQAFVENPDLMQLYADLEEMGLDDKADFVPTNEITKINDLKKMRGAVPERVNDKVFANKRDIDPRISKTAADMIAPFDRVPEMLRMFRDKLSGLEIVIWGHISDGNLHVNVIPNSYDQLEKALEIFKQCGIEVIAFGGSPMAEHGVGRNEIKKWLLEKLYEKFGGIEQMRRVKEVLDPEGKLAPGVLFDKAD